MSQEMCNLALNQEYQNLDILHFRYLPKGEQGQDNNCRTAIGKIIDNIILNCPQFR